MVEHKSLVVNGRWGVLLIEMVDYLVVEDFWQLVLLLILYARVRSLLSLPLNILAIKIAYVNVDVLVARYASKFWHTFL